MPLRPKHILLIIFVCLAFLIGITACSKQEEVPQPKQRGYFRIDLPEHSYQQFDTSALPFTFKYSKNSEYFIDPKADTAIWLLIKYPQLNATLEMTYRPVAHAQQLHQLMMQDKSFVELHYSKASSIANTDMQEIGVKENVSGLFTDIYGKDVACPFHYYLTDMDKHYLRGTLYFYFTPNNDSVQPVIDYIREDVITLAQSFEWK
ncbi:MAG: hypothetical protein J5642_08305 [Bacteroidales bacterium]|nr:hypothetical protein [Bacteroidales bacterium]